MKVSLNLNQPKTRNNVNFEGYKPTKSQYGDREYEFNYVYDDNKYDCYLELFSVGQDNNNNYYVTDILRKYDADPYSNEHGIKLQSGKPTKVDLAGDYDIAPDEAFAYHYKLYPKGTHGAPAYALDAGNKIDERASKNTAHDIYNIVSDRVSTSTKGGAMKLIIPDNYNVIWKYDDKNNVVMKSPEEITSVLKSSKNFANKIGGSLAGIEKDLDDGKLNNFTRVITTPLFTDDSLSAHAYWNKNCFQMANSLGNINNYASLQKKLFAKGMNLVSDGAYVNEGLEGIHFQHVLKWGDKSPYFNWFNISGLQDSPLSLGVFGKKLNHVTHRLINSPYKFVQKKDGTIEVKKSSNYDKNKPTYIQIYDDRLVDADKLSDKELIKAYKHLDKDYLDINTHNDTVVPYSFKINPETYKRNIKLLSDYNKNAKDGQKLDLKSGEATRAVAQFEYFGLDGKHESGFYTWDANPDIAKLNFVPSHADTQSLRNIVDPEERSAKTKLLKQKNMEVQDYAVSSAKYWTKKTNQILNLNVAQHLKNINSKNPEEIVKLIEKQSDGKVFPKDLRLSEKVVKNVLNDSYDLNGTDTVDLYKDAIVQGLMDLPLDSIEIGDDIASVLSSPYVSKRANIEDEIGTSRYEIFKGNNQHINPEYRKAYELTDQMYTKEMNALATEVLNAVEAKLPNDSKLHNEYGNATPYGKYVIPLLTAEIARFAVIKGVDPKAEFSFDEKTGEIAYNYNELKKTSLAGMGIIADSPEDEAISVVKKLRKNINKIGSSDKEKLEKALLKSIQGTNANSFKLADMIIDRTQAGLDWRIDATKDIGDIESVRNQKTDFEFTWNQIIKFWSKFTDAVKEYHPDAYIAAEVTDEGSIYQKGYGSKSGSRFGDSKEAVKKLINEAGFTTTANYTYFSSTLTGIFGKLFADENGVERGTEQGETILKQLVGEGNFLNSEPLESLMYTYTFAGNHDKCRALDGFSMDMGLVYSDLTDPANYDYRSRAYKILHGMGYGDNPSRGEVDGFNYDRISNLAIAKSESIISGMGKAKERIGLSHERKEYVYSKMLEAIKNLSNSRHLGKVYEADGFGTKDYNIALDIVLSEMDYIEPDKNKRLNADEKKKLKDETMHRIIDPAMSKLLGQTKFLVALTGNPTLFAGDELGSTGYETTTKNIYLQNRNVIHNEWINPEDSNYKEFVKVFKDNMDYQFALRKRPELEPLNSGAPFALKEQSAKFEKLIYNDELDHSKGLIGKETGETKVSALLRQCPDGRMTISVFNTAGLNHEYDKYYDPARLTLGHIDLNEGYGGNAGIKYGLRPGMEFKNADKNDQTVYKVNNYNQIVADGNKPISFKDSTLILYSIGNNNQPSFTGRRTMYNPQYNFVSNPYAQINKIEHNVGEKLTIVSK